MASRREERRQMRQRGAATRRIKDVNFGFSFGATPLDASQEGPTRQSPRLAGKASNNPFAPLATSTSSPGDETRQRILTSSPKRTLPEGSAELGQGSKRRRIDNGAGPKVHRVNTQQSNEKSSGAAFIDMPDPLRQAIKPSSTEAENEETMVEAVTEESSALQVKARRNGRPRSKLSERLTSDVTGPGDKRNNEESNNNSSRRNGIDETEAAQGTSAQGTMDVQAVSTSRRGRAKRQEPPSNSNLRTEAQIDNESSRRGQDIGSDENQRLSNYNNSVTSSSLVERSAQNQTRPQRAETDILGSSRAARKTRRGLREAPDKPSAHRQHPKGNDKSKQAVGESQGEDVPARNEGMHEGTADSNLSQKRRHGRQRKSKNPVQPREASKSKQTADDQDPEDRSSAPKKARGETVPITVHRLANVAALAPLDDSASSGGESVSSDDELSLQKTLANRSGVNYADVLSQICRETLEKSLATLKKGIDGESNPTRRAEWTRKRKSVEAYGTELETRLLDMSEVLDANFILSAKVKKSKKAMIDLRNRILELRRQRQEVAIQMDTVRRQHQEEETAKLSRNSINNSLHNLDLVFDRNQFQTSVAQNHDDSAEALNAHSQFSLAGMEFSLRTVGENVSSIAPGSQGGLLSQIKAFNQRLEEAAQKLEGQAPPMTTTPAITIG